VTIAILPFSRFAMHASLVWERLTDAGRRLNRLAGKLLYCTI
jgi:hypothetical protein